MWDVIFVFFKFDNSVAFLFAVLLDVVEVLVYSSYLEPQDFGF